MNKGKKWVVNKVTLSVEMALSINTDCSLLLVCSCLPNEKTRLLLCTDNCRPRRPRTQIAPKDLFQPFQL